LADEVCRLFLLVILEYAYNSQEEIPHDRHSFVVAVVGGISTKMTFSAFLGE
jgi:hypothetical protein